MTTLKCLPSGKNVNMIGEPKTAMSLMTEQMITMKCLHCGKRQRYHNKTTVSCPRCKSQLAIRIR